MAGASADRRKIAARLPGNARGSILNRTKGFTVLGIAMDEEGKPVVAPFIAKERYDVKGQQLPMNYPIVIGNESVAEKFGGLLGYPTSVLISRDGKRLKRVTGIINEEEIT